MSKLSPLDNVSLRPERPDDEPVLYEIYVSTRQEELDRANWNEASKRAFLQMQFQSMRQGYAARFPAAEFALIVHDDSVLGRAVIHRSDEEIRLVDLALLQQHRNQGIGTWLIGNLRSEAQKTGRPLRLSVFADSPAIRLYERLGFREVETTPPYHQMEWRETLSDR